VGVIQVFISNIFLLHEERKVLDIVSILPFLCPKKKKTDTSSCLLNNDSGADTMGIQNICKKSGSGAS
jgi:hypothetical protein